MSIQNYIGWSTGVNRVILDTSTPTFGENALRNDELESGGKRSIQKRAYVPDVFAVTMEFDWVNEVILHKYDQDGNIIPNQDIHTGKTEFQLFVDWYKYEHKYGTVPFEFPKILYSQNTGIDIFDDNDIGSEFRYGNDNVEFYKITNAVQGSKSGERVNVSLVRGKDDAKEWATISVKIGKSDAKVKAKIEDGFAYIKVPMLKQDKNADALDF